MNWAARRMLAAAAYGSTGAAVTGGALVGLLVTEAKLARHWVGKPAGEAPTADGVYGAGPGRTISMVMLGDSMAAGLGAETPAQTPAALIAAGLSERAGAPVHLTNVARIGAQSSDLARQVALALAARPDLALIMVGANDITHRIQPSLACAQLEAAVHQLRAAGVDVVVGTCPDLGTVEPIAQPLRYLVRRASRALAAAQTVVVVEAGGRTVSLGDLCSQSFTTAPAQMFSADRFHPSAAGYCAAAQAVLPSVLAAIGIEDGADESLAQQDGMLPVAFAAVEAAAHPGTEVSGTGSSAGRTGLRGPWALLRRRQLSAPADVDADASNAA